MMIKDGIISIFETKGKKKQKSLLNTALPNAAITSQSKPPTAGQASKDAKENLGKLTLPKVLNQAPEKEKKTAVARIALLHYELNEAALGVTVGKTAKLESPL